MSSALGDMAPIRRSGQPLDIAEAALWLASDASSFVNGQAIAVDGGITTGPLYREQHARIDGLMQFLRRRRPEPLRDRAARIGPAWGCSSA